MRKTFPPPLLGDHFAEREGAEVRGSSKSPEEEEDGKRADGNFGLEEDA